MSMRFKVLAHLVYYLKEKMHLFILDNSTDLIHAVTKYFVIVSHVCRQFLCNMQLYVLN